MAPTSNIHTLPNQSRITPSVRLAGIYQLSLNNHDLPWTQGGPMTIVWVYRNGRLVSQGRGRDSRSALVEARRNVRNARKAGGL